MTTAATTGDQDMNNYSNFFLTTSELHTDNKKKKASRACLHCQKAHLTCDDSRPCQRCIKRDLGSTCTDAARKRAKYLQGIPSENLFNMQPTFNTLQDTHSMNHQNTTNTSTNASSMATHLLYPSQLFDFSLPQMNFGSETVGLEYGFIGNMLENPMDLSGSLSSTTTSTISTPMHLSNISIHQQMTKNNSYPEQSGHTPNIHMNTSTLSPTAVTHTPTVTTTTTTTTTTTPSTATNTSSSSSSSSNQPITSYFQLSSSPMSFTQTLSSPATPTPRRPSPLIEAIQSSSYTMKRASVSSTGRRKGFGNTPEETYANVRKPFNYAEGFHYLIQYVKDKMGRDDLMRISKALALFRPSFLALIMNLTEEDLVFMEKCIQRTLLEYEKLISFSGTPTIVWRRTGEICLVGKEFSLLTQWTKDMLLNKKIYIYELMDSQSAVEYWEKFSTHAFDNTDKSCIYSCIIKTPQQKPVPCTFCFTIKRDIFDLPSVIIGNFLPILS